MMGKATEQMWADREAKGLAELPDEYRAKDIAQFLLLTRHGALIHGQKQMLARVVEFIQSAPPSTTAGLLAAITDALAIPTMTELWDQATAPADHDATTD